MNRMVRIANCIKRDFVEVLPVTVFFLIGLNLIAFSKHLVLAEQGIVYEGIATATFGALVIAKIVLVADKLPIMRFGNGRPLYQTILLRAVFYSLCVLVFRLLEMFIGHWLEQGDLGGGFDTARAEFIWDHMIFLQLWTLVLFLVYLSVVELLEIVGEGSRAKGLFFRRSHSDAVNKQAASDR